MAQKCKFCKKGETKTIFKANKSRPVKLDQNLFACTNCGFGQHGRIIQCQDCGIVYVAEKRSQGEISTYYEIAQDPLYFKEQSARAKTFQHYLSRLQKTFPQKGKLLDVGTNTGLFVKLAQDAGWQALGIEPNRWAVEYAWKNYKVKLIAKPFRDKIFPAQSLDVVTMWDVIEHFVDPVAEMRRVYGFLKKGGVFAFTTVDPHSSLAKAMGTSWPWYMEMHRVFFDRETARNYLTKAGFKKIIFKPHWRFLSLGYLTTRFAAVSQTAAGLLFRLTNLFKLNRLVIPYYANDLFDCYAFK